MTLDPTIEQHLRSKDDRMLAAWFEPTGCEAVDLILTAVAAAGNAYHSTEWWGEPMGCDDDSTSWIDAIQACADAAAAHMKERR